MNEKQRVRLKPTQVLVLSFIITIIVGTILLSLPQSSNGYALPCVDALFTATSATCVTGLIVVPTGEQFTLFGQLIILSLIQLGGLGIMTFSSFFAVVLGKRITLKDRIVIQESLSSGATGEILTLLKYVLIFTISAEALGATLLYFRFHNIYQAIFHSVSAFCNAGFSLWPTSLISYKEDFIVNFIITSLIIIGGIGFIVVADLKGALRGRKSSLHTKVTILVSVVLILFSTAIIFLLEYGNTLKFLPLKTKVLTSYFQAVTPRTAGFNTLDIAQLTKATLFFIIILMFIGGSSGSTAGGIKTGTFLVLAASVSSMLKGREEVEIFGRTIPKDISHKALSIVILSLVLIMIGVFSLLIIEKRGSFLHLLFEVVSAFGTVGLSTGITPYLSILGKIVITIIMFVGRVGPLTLALAVGGQKTLVAYKYPEEEVIVG
ncbi:MAG: TrkH family potassium uptake protein [bacterium]|nr:TrkH family potassium uptake protein [bacterium]